MIIKLELVKEPNDFAHSSFADPAQYSAEVTCFVGDIVNKTELDSFKERLSVKLAALVENLTDFIDDAFDTE